MSLPVSHWVPTKPSGQKQAKDPGRSWQVPPFLQGSDWHSLTSGEQQEERHWLSTATGSEARDGGFGEAALLPQGTDSPRVTYYPQVQQPGTAPPLGLLGPPCPCIGLQQELGMGTCPRAHSGQRRAVPTGPCSGHPTSSYQALGSHLPQSPTSHHAAQHPFNHNRAHT